MRFSHLAATLCVSAFLASSAFAQVLVTPLAETKPKPVAHDVVASDDTPEEIAADAARDLKDTRFYNKPGATRAQYDADWQTCRLIARGSKTPGGMVVTTYNPAIISPAAAAAGGGIGALIGQAIVEGQQRRANRRNCLLIKGWRLVELDDADAARISAMSDADRDAYFNTIVGAQDVSGKITERKSFAHVTDAALKPDAPVPGPGTLFLGKKVDLAQPFKLAPGEAAIVLAFRRPDEGSAGRSGSLHLLRYDPAKRDIVYQPRDWKKTGDKTVYSLLAASRDKKSSLEVQVLRVTPGDYVISGTSSVLPITRTFCFGAPTFSIGEGQVLYLGDFIPFHNVKLANGGKFSDLVRTAHIEDSRTVLAGKQPELAAALAPAALRNNATFACAGTSMDRWDIAGAEALPALDAAPHTIAAPATDATVEPVTP